MAKVKTEKLIIVVGEASYSKSHEEPGDQSQVEIPDLLGEVLMTRYSSEDSFISRFHIKNDFKVLRPLDPDIASLAAKYMIQACNNPNIGYILGGKGMSCAGGTQGTDAEEPCGTDCSELVSQCFAQATGISNLYAYCGSMERIFCDTHHITKCLGSFISWQDTPVYTGDIMLKWVPNIKEDGTPDWRGSGHAAMIVNGNPREGTTDELLDFVTDEEEEEEEEEKEPTRTEKVVEERELYKIEKVFEPRRKAPTSGDDGYKFYQQSYGSSKNGSYAWGRFSEIGGFNCTLSKGEPRRWFNNIEDGYKRGMAPSLGAVMCFTNIYKASDPGYVCIVEHIQGDYIYTSQYSLSGKFEYEKRSMVDGSWDMDLNEDGVNEYIFQGFIYNSAVDLEYLGIQTNLQKFIETAKNQLGLGPEFTQRYGGYNTKIGGWSAAFIRAVAAKSGGLLGVVLPDTTSCSAIGSTGVTLGLGTWLDGPALGGKPNPQVGDIALFREHITSGRLKYASDKAGIVIEVSTSGTAVSSGTVKYSFKVIMGDCEGMVLQKSYTTVSETLSGLFRPAWSKVDSIQVSPQQIVALYGMYTEEATVEDAAIRDLRYLNATTTKKKKSIITEFKPSISKTGIKLCAINYTGMLANLYGAFAEMDEYLQRRDEQENPVPNTSDTTSKDNEEKNKKDKKKEHPEDDDLGSDVVLLGDGSVEVKGKLMVADNTFIKIYAFLRQYLNNDAGAIGIMGNMFQESGFCTNAENSKGYAGLCQWDPVSRGAKMKDFCLEYNGQEWQTNLMGQLNYLAHELDTDYMKVRNTCRSVPKTKAGANEACETFLKKFEIPGNYETELPLRVAFTMAVWKLVFGDKK